MKVKVYPEHKRVIATGIVKGKRIKAIAVCQEGDTFDADFGVSLASQKLKVTEKKALIASHESKIRAAQRKIAHWKSIIETENKIISSLNASLLVEVQNEQKILAQKYPEASEG